MNTVLPPEVVSFLGSNDPAALFQMAVAAVVTAFVMVLTPNKIKLVAWLYLAAMAGMFYLHATQYVNLFLAVGVVASLVFLPFRPKAKTA